MSTQQFNPTLDLQEIRLKRKAKQRKTYRRSRLHKYRAEIIALRRQIPPASLRDIAAWLRTKKRCRVCFTTVGDFINKLPELKEKKNAAL